MGAKFTVKSGREKFPHFDMSGRERIEGRVDIFFFDLILISLIYMLA
jgi:hypothetical protein